MRLTLVFLLVLATGACSATVAPTGSPAPTPATSPTPTATVDPLAAPEELQGNWRTALPDGGSVTVIIAARNYTVLRFDTVHGKVQVDGNQIRFSDSDACPNGIGTYRWNVDGDSLTLTSIRPDECPNRAAVLDGFTFTRRL
jgi:hypothetical protein